MASTSESQIAPPGQERPSPKPTKTGMIPFEYALTGLKGETFYELWGDLSSSKTPLICLHGGPGMAGYYMVPISLINSDYDIPVLIYHQIGCGKSTLFPERKGDTAFWTPELFMAELDNIKEHLGIRSFDLLGQSWGGMLASQYAVTKQPAGLRKLILANSPSDMRVWVKVANQLREKLPEGPRDALVRCEREGRTDSQEYEDAMMPFYARHVCRVQPFPPELEATLASVKEDPTVYETMNGPSEFHVVGSLKDWAITDQLHLITAKTCPGGLLVINGHFDEAQDEVARPFFLLPSCRTKWVQFALSSHLPQLEETEKFMAVLGGFLESEQTAKEARA